MAKRGSKKGEQRLFLRPLRITDFQDVQRVHGLAYPGLAPWTKAQLKSQIELFPEGQLCVEMDGQVVATSGGLIVDMDDLHEQHTYADVCQDGYIRGHNPDGDMLYGIDIAVDPAHRGHRLARRLYDARKELAQALNLRGIVFGGRMPRYHKYAEEMTPEEYVRRVLRREIRDPVITAQLANGFVAQDVIENYLPSDKASGGHALLMEWKNSSYLPVDRRKRLARSMRVAVCQYQMRSLNSFEEFEKQCEFFIETASEFRADFLVFPELLTNQLLSLVKTGTPAKSARALAQFTPQYLEFFGKTALRYNVNIIAGTHLTVEKKKLYNIAYLFHRDGRLDRQYKVHITPSEAKWWGVSPGHDIHTFKTDRGKVAIAICYDVEFPEWVRIAKAKGAEVLFVPYNTDIRSGHLRVRSCAAARSIENHMYVVLAGAVGNLPQVEGADIHYGQSSILTPSDIPFARDGVAAEATPNVETMLIHELDLSLLRRTEATGTVRPWPDRRRDLYSIEYKEDGKKTRL